MLSININDFSEGATEGEEKHGIPQFQLGLSYSIELIET